MTYTTELLENESGIQYQGVKDKSGSIGTYPITGLMTGIFKRGRFDKPMTITNENIRAQLGYDPKNSYYVAVQDVLSSGVPSVQVLRLNGGGTLPIFPVIPEENIRDTINYSGWFGLYWMSDVEWHLEIDDILYKQTTPFGTPYFNTMDGSIAQIILDHNLTFLDRYENSSGGGSFYLNTVGTKKIRFIPQSLATQFPDKYPTPITDTGGAIPIIDPTTGIWSFILRNNQE